MASTSPKSDQPDSSARKIRKRTASPALPPDVKKAIAAILDKKAQDVVVLDLGGAAFTDHFVICTGGNSRQMQAIADAVEDTLRRAGERPAIVEGYDRAEWILIDFFDFVVHIFTPVARDFYALEKLWGDARRIEIPAT